MNQSRWWNSAYHDGAMFVWDMTYRCNYRCAYCWWDPLWEAMESEESPYSAEEWVEAWERVGDSYGALRLDVLGGEPFLFPGFDGLLVRLSRRHRILVTTNLSIRPSRLGGLLERVDPEHVHVNASFHPAFSRLDDFLDNIRRLREGGFDPSVLYVTYPPHLEAMAACGEVFSRESVPFVPMIFRGSYAGRTYPADYTDRERRLIAEALPRGARQRRVEYELEERTTLGRLCYAGALYARVTPSGEVYRCGGGGAGFIGHLFDNPFSLKGGATPCPFQRCQCREFVFLKDEIESKGRLSQVNEWLAAHPAPAGAL